MSTMRSYEIAMLGVARDPFATPVRPPQSPVERDARTVLSLVPEDAPAPEVEWNDDGGLVLRWTGEDGVAGLALVLDGSRTVIGVVSAKGGIVPPWKVDVHERDALLRHLAEPHAASVLRPGAIAA